MKYLTIILTVFLLKACGNTKEVANMQENKSTSEAQIVLGKYNVIIVGNFEVLNDKKLNISFNDSTNVVSGFSGCNTFFGDYSTSGSQIMFGTLASTRKMCDKDSNTLEHHMLQSLSKVDSFSLENNILKLREGNKVHIVAEQEMNSEKVLQDNGTTIEYSATTRGYYFSIVINKESITIQKVRDGKKTTRLCPEEEWKNLMNAVSEINLEGLSELEAPTNTRHYDAAPFGLLKIKQVDTIYQSANFDHGTPPEEIKALVELILSLDEKG